MGVNEEGTKVGLRQTVEGVVDPKGKEEDEGGVSNCQVQHVDVGVCPAASNGNKGTKGSSVDKKPHTEHRDVSQTLNSVHCATGDVDATTEVHLCEKKNAEIISKKNPNLYNYFLCVSVNIHLVQLKGFYYIQ